MTPKKIFISADIEGVACISAPAETDIGAGAEYTPFQRQMTNEVAGACDGAFGAGASEILVKDGHGTARNIDPHALTTPADRRLRLIRGWSGHPFKMVQGLDDSFAAAVFVGFHSGAGSGGNPLSHTVSGSRFAQIELNGEAASEFAIYAMAAATVGIPVVFLSGDAALCAHATRRIPGIETVSVLEGFGASAASMLPDEAVRRIRDGVRRAVADIRTAPLAVPPDFHFRITFVKPFDAYARSFYPGATLASDTDVVLETTRFFDVLTFLTFATR